MKKRTHSARTFIVILLSCGLAAVSPLAASMHIDTVTVGNAGNLADAATGYGAVGYNYHVSTYEVTNAQYTTFLNSVASTDTHGVYNALMGSHALGGIERSGTSGSYTYTVKDGFANKPVNYVSFWDAARFSNWLTNGQPTGSQDASTTESGTYALNGVTNPNNSWMLRDTTAFNNGGVAIANADEWYKAAYYDPSLNTGNGGYWLYPTQSNGTPLAQTAPGGSNSANFMDQEFYSPYGNPIDVGSYIGTTSAYGAYDMAGNVSEWLEEINGTHPQWRNYRGGSFGDWPIMQEADYESPGLLPDQVADAIGFRIVSLNAIPEPSSYALLAGLTVALIAMLRRRQTR